MQDLQALCAAYDITPSGPAVPVTARVWRLPTASGDIAIKRHGLDRLEHAQKEAVILAHLLANPDPRFGVPVICPTSQGNLVWVGADGPALLTRWAHGTHQTYERFTDADWQSLGASLAALHDRLDSLSLPGVDTLGTRLHALDPDAARRSLRQALCRASRLGRAQTLRAHVKTCQRLIDTYYEGSVRDFPVQDAQRLIHNDYNQFNYVFGVAPPPVIIDWEAAIGAPRAYELVRCLNHLPLQAPEQARHFVQAYGQVRPVAPAQMAWAVDAACLQHALKPWVLHGWLDDASRFAAHLEGAIRMAATLDGARDRLIGFYERCVSGGRA